MFLLYNKVIQLYIYVYPFLSEFPSQLDHHREPSRVPCAMLLCRCWVTPDSCDFMNSSPPDSSVHGISQAKILEWFAISFSGGSSQCRDQTRVSFTTGRFFTTEPPGTLVLYSIIHVNRMFSFSICIAWTEVWIINTQLILYLLFNVYYQYIVNINGWRQVGTEKAGIQSIYENYMRTKQFMSSDTRQGGLCQAGVKDYTRSEL